MQRRRFRWEILGWIPAVGVTLLGGAYLLLCFAAWASTSLPYQDAPAALLVKQEADIREAWQGVRTGAAVSTGGLAGIVVLFVRARRRAKSRATIRLGNSATEQR